MEMNLERIPIELNGSLTLNAFDLPRTKTSEGTLVLRTSEARPDGTLQVGDRSSSRGATFSGSSGIGHLLCDFFFRGVFLVVLGSVGKLEVIQGIEGVVH